MKHAINPYSYATAHPFHGGSDFTRGFVAAACVSAFQDIENPAAAANLKRALRYGLQGGTALAAGSHAAQSLRQGSYGSALLAVAAGAAGVLMIENLLRDPVQPKEKEPHE
jgi:hypothetical protein